MTNQTILKLPQNNGYDDYTPLQAGDVVIVESRQWDNPDKRCYRVLRAYKHFLPHIINDDGTLADFNPSFQRITGYIRASETPTKFVAIRNGWTTYRHVEETRDAHLAAFCAEAKYDAAIREINSL